MTKTSFQNLFDGFISQNVSDQSVVNEGRHMSVISSRTYSNTHTHTYTAHTHTHRVNLIVVITHAAIFSNPLPCANCCTKCFVHNISFRFTADGRSTISQLHFPNGSSTVLSHTRLSIRCIVSPGLHPAKACALKPCVGTSLLYKRLGCFQTSWQYHFILQSFQLLQSS